MLAAISQKVTLYCCGICNKCKFLFQNNTRWIQTKDENSGTINIRAKKKQTLQRSKLKILAPEYRQASD